MGNNQEDVTQENQFPSKATIQNEVAKEDASHFRTILPQFIAATAKNFLSLDMGMAAAFPTIVIPTLRRTLAATSYVETVFLSDEQASWFGSTMFICKPIGCLLSAMILDPLGRKRSMILVNIPHIMAWTIFYFTDSVEMLFAGVILLGMGVGFMETPTFAYVGEISQPSIRGILISCATFFFNVGVLFVYLLGPLTQWRNAALICLFIPVMTMILICFIPETPIWLLSKRRNEDAIRSLQWLRGWVSAKAVETEFQDLQRYTENSNKCTSCFNAKTSCAHPPETLPEKLKGLMQKRMLKSFGLVLTILAIGQFSGLLAMRPFLVQIFKAYGVCMDPSWATVAFGAVGILANIGCTVFVRIIGKRMICLIGYSGCLVSCITLGAYGEMYFPSNYNSFDEVVGFDIPSAHLPFVTFLVYAFCTFGAVGTANMLLSEVFPFKSRSFATAIAASINFGMAFIATKIYINLDKGLSLKGTMWLYAAINLVGVVLIYVIMPETENFSLEDIELYFSESNRKWSNVVINRNNRLFMDMESGIGSKAKDGK